MFLPAEPVLHAQNDSLEALDDSSPAPPPYPPPVYDEIILSNRRSIFAAPPWNPDVEGESRRESKFYEKEDVHLCPLTLSFTTSDKQDAR